MDRRSRGAQRGKASRNRDDSAPQEEWRLEEARQIGEEKRQEGRMWTESGSSRTNEGRAAAEMIMIATTNGVFIHTARSNPPAR